MSNLHKQLPGFSSHFKTYTRERNGRVCFRVRGKVHGKWQERQFSDRSAADRFAAQQNAAHFPIATERTIRTTLSDGQIQQAVAAFQLLPPGISLVEAMRFAADHYRPVRSVLIKEAKSAYLVKRGKRGNSFKYVEQIDWQIGAFRAHAGISETVQITRARCEAWIYRNRLSNRSRRDRYDHLKRFASFLVREKYLAFDPMGQIDRPMVGKEKLPAILTPEQIQTLLDHAYADRMIFSWFAICALSGIRPDEAKGVEDEDFLLDLGICELWRHTKGRKPRNVDLSEGLVDILDTCRAEKLPFGYFTSRRFNQVRRAAAVFDLWETDVLRHSYASYHYAVHKDINALAATMGNSPDVLFGSYIRPVRLAQARAFFAINSAHYP